MSEETLELLIPILAVIFGSMIVLIPIAGLTLRFAFKPALESYMKLRETQMPDVRVIEQRLAAVENELRALRYSTAPAQRLVEAPQSEALSEMSRPGG